MEILGRHYDDKLKALLDEADNARPELPLSLEVMSDPAMLKGSGGGVYESTPQGGKIYLDPARADDYTVGHELVHATLDRNGFPKVATLLRDDKPGRLLAARMNDIVEHPLVNDKLAAAGFAAEVQRAYEAHCSRLEKWSHPEPAGIPRVFDAFQVAEALAYMKEAAERLVFNLRPRYPNTWKLAEEIVKVRAYAAQEDHLIARKRLINLLKLLDRQIKRLLGPAHGIEDRFTCSLVMANRKAEREPAKRWLKVELAKIEPKGLLTYCLIFRYQDGSIIRGMTAPGYQEQPDARIFFDDLDELSLGEYLTKHKFRFSFP